MTDQEIAAIRYQRHCDDERGVTHPHARTIDALLAHIAATGDAVKAEREACAKVMERYANGNHDDRNRAAAIRARNE